LIKTGIAEGKENRLVYVNNDEIQTTLDSSAVKQVQFTGILAMAPYVTWENPTTLFSIEASDGKSTKIVFEKEIDILNFYNTTENLDLAGLEGEITFKYKHTFLDGTPTNWNFMTVINPEIKIIS